MHKFWKLKEAWCSAPNEQHIPQLLAFFDDTEILRYGDGSRITICEARDICSGRRPWFFIFSSQNELIGTIALLRMFADSAEVCLLLKKKWRRMGIGREALERLSAVACSVFNLKRLYARVMSDNYGAQIFFEKCGYLPIDQLPEHLRVPDEGNSKYYVHSLTPPSPLALSVIIPVNNCARWIEECIRSLDNIPCEIIVCDDKSDDSTAEIVYRLACRDDRIKLIALTERGYAGGARNAALRVAKGEYIFFLDGDDRLCDRNVCRRMFMAAAFSRADMICSSEVEYFDNYKSWRHILGSQYKGMIGTDQRPMMYSRQIPVWMSWFRRGFIEDCQLKFAEGVASYEDNLFSFVVASCAKSMTTVPGPLVAHRIRSDSLSHIDNTFVQTTFLEVSRQQYSYAKSKGLLRLYPETMYNCFFHSVFMTAVHVWHLLGEVDDWVIMDAMAFLHDAFSDMDYALSAVYASEAQKEEFKLAWNDVSAYLKKYRKEQPQ